MATEEKTRHRVLVTGATGLLGRAVLAEFVKTHLWSVVGTGFSRASGSIRKVDLGDAEAVAKCFADVKPHFVLHCAAERRPDKSEKDPEHTRRLNVQGTRIMAENCKSAGAVMVYISSDYVFDGTHPPYRVDSPTHPLNFYGQTKLEGEKVVAEVLPERHITLRVPVLYGHVYSLDESSITAVAKHLLNTVPAKIDNWATRYPTHVNDVAVVVAKLCERRLHDTRVNGVYQWSGDEAMTKYGIALLMGKVLKRSVAHLAPDNTDPGQGAPRPKDAHLDTSKVAALGIGHCTPCAQGFHEVLEPFFNEDAPLTAEPPMR